MSFTPPPKSPPLLEHWEILRCRLFWAYDHPLVRSRPQWEYPPFPTAAWLIREGELTITFPDGEERYQAGEWIFPANREGILSAQQGTHLLSIRFLAEWPGGLHLFDRSRTLRLAQETCPRLTEASERLVALISSHFPNYPGGRCYLHGQLKDYFIVQPALYEWLLVYYETLCGLGIEPASFVHLHEKTRGIIQFLEHWQLNEKISEPEIARRVGLSVSQMNKVFTRELGMTPIQFLNRRRYRLAQAWLMGGSESVKVIAYNLGFSSPENFSHWFRRIAGESPRACRRRFGEQ